MIARDRNGAFMSTARVSAGRSLRPRARMLAATASAAIKNDSIGQPSVDMSAPAIAGPQTRPTLLSCMTKPTVAPTSLGALFAELDRGPQRSSETEFVAIGVDQVEEAL